MLSTELKLSTTVAMGVPVGVTPVGLIGLVAVGVFVTVGVFVAGNPVNVAVGVSIGVAVTVALAVGVGEKGVWVSAPP